MNLSEDQKLRNPVFLHCGRLRVSGTDLGDIVREIDTLSIFLPLLPAAQSAGLLESAGSVSWVMQRLRFVGGTK